MTDYSTMDIRPDEWRRLLGPVGAGWVLAAGVARYPHITGWAILRGAVGPERDSGPAADEIAWIGLILALVLAWATAGWIALAGGWLVERAWLGGWVRVGRPLVRWRQNRWDSQDPAAGQTRRTRETVDHERIRRRRSAIGLIRPGRATWMGDRWLALDARVLATYGLDVTSTWPRLWLVLPDPVRTELRTAAAHWHHACGWASWAMLYGLIGIVWWPGLGVAAILAGWAWGRGRLAIADRCDLIEAAYDTYGTDLARAMGVALPSAGRPEASTGPLDARTGRIITARIRKGA